MKKAKIMLTAIAVLAVVGGALAFKAKSAANVYCKNTAGTTCTKALYQTTQISAVTTTNPCTSANVTVFYRDEFCEGATSTEAGNTVYVTID